MSVGKTRLKVTRRGKRRLELTGRGETTSLMRLEVTGRGENPDETTEGEKCRSNQREKKVESKIKAESTTRRQSSLER